MLLRRPREGLREGLAEAAFAQGTEYLFDGPVEGLAAGDGEGGAGLGGEDELLGHGADGGGVLLADTGFGAAAFADVAVDAAAETDLVGGVDEDGDGVERAGRGEVHGEDAFDDDEVGGGDGVKRAGDAGVGAEVVDGSLDGVAFGEGAEMRDKELAFKRVGVVEVALVAGVERELGEIAVVQVQWEERGFELGGEFAGEGGFAGAGTAGDAEEDRALREAQLFGAAHGFSVPSALDAAGLAAGSSVQLAMPPFCEGLLVRVPGTGREISIYETCG